MNEREIAEIRRRFRPEKNNIGRIRGCCVNEKKEIISRFDQMLGMITEGEAEELLSVFRKTLSGGIGQNLIDISFSNSQVLESDEHGLLSALRDSSLSDDNAVNRFFEKAVEALDTDSAYLILLANDKYDILSYGEDGEKKESTEMFSYILCAVCPVRSAKPSLSYYVHESRFKSILHDSIVKKPVCGFMFPAFTGRTSDIYSALYYTDSPENSHTDFADAVFHAPIPRPAREQTEAFSSLLNTVSKEECDLELIQTVQGQIHDLLEDHRANKEEEPLTFEKKDVVTLLHSSGMTIENAQKVGDSFEKEFGSGTAICPQNIVDTKRFALETPDVSVRVSPEKSDLLETRIIDGTKYILIRAEGDIRVNGISININE